MTIKKILVPFDASGYSKRAFKTALDICQSHNAKIMVATVMPGKYSSGLGFTVTLDSVQKNKEKTFADKVLCDLKRSAQKAGVDFSSVIIINSSVEKGILDYANSHKIDMIVMGSHGRTPFKRLVLGSVANNILNHASCPVLIVK